MDELTLNKRILDNLVALKKRTRAEASEEAFFFTLVSFGGERKQNKTAGMESTG